MLQCFLGATPAAEGNGEDATILLPQAPAGETAGEDATVLLGNPEAEKAYTPPLQQPGQDVEGASTRHLFPATFFYT